jgi:large subunit ribosomal protein L10
VTLRLEDKKEIVAAVNEAANNAFSAVVADYRGLTVSQLTQLRSKAREQNVYVRVVRNTLARRALEGTNFSLLNDALVGPSIIGLSMSVDDMGAAARLFKDFAKDNAKLEIKVGAYEGKLFAGDEIDVLAKHAGVRAAGAGIEVWPTADRAERKERSSGCLIAA